MEKVNADLKHDFINNSLRLEVLMRLVCEDLNKKTTPQKQFLDDLEDFLKAELNLLKEIKSDLHEN